MPVERCDRLIEGRVLYAREDEDGKGVRGWVDAVYEGQDFAAFARHAEDAVVELGWRFLGTERVEWFVPTTSGARRLALAIEALGDDAMVLGTAYEWPAGPEAIDPEETAALEDAMASQRLVSAGTFDDDVLGFVVDFSDALVLVHAFDRDVIALNGYAAMRRSEFVGLRSVEDHFLHEAARAAGVGPTDPGADLADLPSFLRWAGRLGLVGVHHRDDPSSRFVGGVATVDDELLVLHGVDRTGAWADTFEYRVDDLVMVDVLDTYLRALERVAGPRK